MNKRIVNAAADYYAKTLDASDGARLAFFRKLWDALEGVAPAKEAAYEVPAPAKLRELSEAATPVFSEFPAPTDAEALAGAVAALVACAAEGAAFSPEATEALSGVDWARALATDQLADASRDAEAYLESVAEALVEGGLAEDVARLAALFVSLALRAQWEGPAAAVQQARRDAGLSNDHQRTCPVCGSEAAVARVGEGEGSDGRGKTLWCPQCAAVWTFDRVRCARCGTRNQAHLHYFNIEGDDSHRLATCEECGGYIRTRYDDDSSRAPLSYEVEDVVMARLDAVAADPSFAGGAKA